MSFGDVNRVNTNLQSLGAQFSLNKINNKLASNQLKLSTGLRINKAEDDSAGFSIASKLSSKLGGMNQAMRNIGDAKSMLDVAETGMNSIMDTLIDMKSKATQAATDSVGSDERGYIGDQIEALAKEINNIVDQTDFQGKSLLKGDPSLNSDGDNTNDGTGSLSLTFQVGESSSDTYSVSIDGISNNTLFADLKTGSGGGGVDITGMTIQDGSGTGTPMGNLTIDNSTATSSSYSSLIDEIDKAISTLASGFNQIGIDQNSLSIKQDNISQAITSNSAARSRIQDTDFAKVQSEVVRQQIQQQTATAALAQANSSPQAVLGFMGR